MNRFVMLLFLITLIGFASTQFIGSGYGQQHGYGPQHGYGQQHGHGQQHGYGQQGQQHGYGGSNSGQNLAGQILGSLGRRR